MISNFSLGAVPHVWGLHWNWRIQHPVHRYSNRTGFVFHHRYRWNTHRHSLRFLRRIHHQVHGTCQSHRTSLCVCHWISDVPYCWNVSLVQYIGVCYNNILRLSKIFYYAVTMSALLTIWPKNIILT